MLTQNYITPTKISKPWNVFSTSDNYETANCNEFIRAQFQKAINDVYFGLTDPQEKTLFENAYYVNDAVKELAPGLHIIPPDFNAISPLPANAITMVEVAVNLLEGSAVSDHYFEGTLVNHWFVNDKRYKFLNSCPTCGEYPPLPWHLLILAKMSETTDKVWQEAHHTTVTPGSFLGSEFFEEAAY